MCLALPLPSLLHWHSPAYCAGSSQVREMGEYKVNKKLVFLAQNTSIRLIKIWSNEMMGA